VSCYTVKRIVAFREAKKYFSPGGEDSYGRNEEEKARGNHIITSMTLAEFLQCIDKKIMNWTKKVALSFRNVRMIITMQLPRPMKSRLRSNYTKHTPRL
jgi:hypothetical protein